MAYSSEMFRQLGQPHGTVGRKVLKRLNRVNQGMNDLTRELLNVRADDRILEIGFGGGALIADILARHPCNYLLGIDVSKLAISEANKRFRHEITAGKVAFRQSNGIEMEAEAGEFTRICCVNVIYFWPDVTAQLQQIYRTLAADGKLVLSYSEGSPDNKTRFPREYVESELIEAGFDNLRSVGGRDRENGNYHCTSAHKSS